MARPLTNTRWGRCALKLRRRIPFAGSLRSPPSSTVYPVKLLTDGVIQPAVIGGQIPQAHPTRGINPVRMQTCADHQGLIQFVFVDEHGPYGANKIRSDPGVGHIADESWCAVPLAYDLGPVIPAGRALVGKKEVQ